MDCANCANLMEEAARKTCGVQNATVNFMTQKMIVELTRARIPPMLCRMSARPARRSSPTARSSCNLILPFYIARSTRSQGDSFWSWVMCGVWKGEWTMQELIVNLLLVVVAVLAAILRLIGQSRTAV